MGNRYLTTKAVRGTNGTGPGARGTMWLMGRNLLAGGCLALWLPLLLAGCPGLRKVPPPGDAAADQGRGDSAWKFIDGQLEGGAPGDLAADIEAGSAEVCDGVDNDGDGVVDEGSYLPTPWDGATYAPKGYFGAGKEVLVVLRDELLYVVQLTPPRVLSIITIASTDPKLNKDYSGVSPPPKGYTALAAVPKGTFGGVQADSLVFARGAQLYILTSTGPTKATWSSTSLAQAFKDQAHQPTRADAADMIQGKPLGLAEDTFFIFDGSQLYSLTSKGTSAALAATALYPAGSTGPQPPATPDAAFMVATQWGLALASGAKLHSATVAAGGTSLAWKPVKALAQAFPCGK